MFEKNKKAISPIIATVLMIVITIAVVAIVIAFVIPFINNQMDSTKACFGVVLSVEEGGSCYNVSSDYGELILEISRDSNEYDLSGIKAILGTPDGQKAYTIKSGQSSYGIRMSSGSYNGNLELPELSESRIYVFNLSELNIGEITTVSVAPIVKIKNRDYNCEAMSEISIANCAS